MNIRKYDVNLKKEFLVFLRNSVSKLFEYIIHCNENYEIYVILAVLTTSFA